MEGGGFIGGDGSRRAVVGEAAAAVAVDPPLRVDEATERRGGALHSGDDAPRRAGDVRAAGPPVREGVLGVVLGHAQVGEGHDQAVRLGRDLEEGRRDGADLRGRTVFALDLWDHPIGVSLWQ